LKGKLKERNVSEHLGLDGKITLKLILKKEERKILYEFVSVRVSTSVWAL